MDFIQNKKTGIIYDASGDGYATEWEEKPGRIKNKWIASKGKWCPIFNPDGLDPVGNDVFADYQYDLSRTYLAVESEEEPPAPTLDCSVLPVVTIESDATYKTLNTDGTTNVKLIIAASGSQAHEFSTKKSGPFGANGLNGFGEPQYWLPIAKDGVGFFNITLPSTGDPESIWVRKVGCVTNGTWLAKYTYRPDGSDPLITTGGGGTTGTGNAVVTDFPQFMGLWGFFGGRSREYDDHLRHKTHYGDQSALSDPDYKEARPFYAIDGHYKIVNGELVADPNPTTVPVGIWSDVIHEHVIQNRYADTDWQMTQANMDWIIEYLVRSGLQYFKFEYYANGFDGAIMRTLFEQNPNKRGVKAAYVVGQFGGDMNNWGNPNDDYTKNLNHFVWAMRQDWYQRIDNKPVVFLFQDVHPLYPDAIPNMVTTLNRIRSTYGGDIYEVYMTSGLSNDYSIVDANGMDARSWYYNTDDAAFGSHDINSPNQGIYDTSLAIAASGKEVVPCFTIALDNRARNEYPGHTYQKGTPNDGLGINYVDKSYSYYNAANQAAIQNCINKNLALRAAHPTKVKTGGYSTGDELTEGWLSCWMPKKRINGTTNDDVVMWFKQELNPTYVIS